MIRLRRCQIVLASARGERVPATARSLGCSEQAVRNALHACDAQGEAALGEGSSRPHTIHAAFDADSAAQLRALLHRSPRDYGHPTSVWTLELAAATAYATGLTTTRVSDETIRATLAQAQAHAGWTVGFADETWWSRLARPALHTWREDAPLRLVEQTVGRADYVYLLLKL